MPHVQTVRAPVTGTRSDVAEDRADAGLVRQIAGGDREALGELYARFQRPIFRYLCQLTPDRGLAEEILQDTLVAVWKGAGTFEARSSVRTWLFGIARRQAHNALRRRSMLPAGDLLDDLPDPGPAPEEHAIAGASRDEVQQAIARLSPIHREVLVLNFVTGLSYGEIARVLEVPEGTVKSRLSNAKRALRDLMTEG